MAPSLILSASSNILWPLHWALLPKLYVNRNFPSTMIVSSLAVRGLALKSLEIEQGLKLIALLTAL